jgi:hypothetical protein
LFGRRGFKLERSGRVVFQTSHPFGILPSSSATLGDDTFKFSLANLVGDKLNIRKNGHRIGQLDFSHYQYSSFTLHRDNGGVDEFRIDEHGYSYIYSLSQSGAEIIRLKGSLNPFLVDNKFEIDVVAHIYGGDVLHELMLYTGEILYRAMLRSGGEI